MTAHQRPATKRSTASERESAPRRRDLHFVTDAEPGIRRKVNGGHFTYIGIDQRPVRDEAELARFKGLAVPPAWTDVWISPDPLGHIQATGRDARGRKQYRYHPAYRRAREEAKYAQLAAFGRVLGRIRATVDRDLARRGLPRAKVLAAVVALLDAAHVRIGNDEYTRANGSFGLTTLRNRHARVSGAEIALRFKGKSGKEHRIGLRDARLARIVKRCQDLPGQQLFEYVDETDEICRVDSADVNAYIREVAGEAFSAKDFRTWAGTLIVAESLDACQHHESAEVCKRAIIEAVDAAAARLGNTRAVCRASYVHPAVLHGFESGATLSTVHGKARPRPRGLGRSELLLLGFLDELARPGQKVTRNHGRASAARLESYAA
jgi:DNA topoisomerase-1